MSKTKVKKIEIKNADLAPMSAAITELLLCSIVDGKIIYRLNKLLKTINDYLNCVQETKRDISKTLADKDVNGKPIILYPKKEDPNYGVYQIRKNASLYDIELANIDNETVELEVIPIKYDILWEKAKKKENFGPRFSVLLDTVIECDDSEEDLIEAE
mgnify:CR=1 FL=1